MLEWKPLTSAVWTFWPDRCSSQGDDYASSCWSEGHSPLQFGRFELTSVVIQGLVGNILFHYVGNVQHLEQFGCEVAGRVLMGLHVIPIIRLWHWQQNKVNWWGDISKPLHDTHREPRNGNAHSTGVKAVQCNACTLHVSQVRKYILQV